MKLEKITIEGNEYYQFVKLGTVNTVGDIFSTSCTSKDIRTERAKFINLIK